MKAIVSDKYGPPDVLEYKEAAKPAPKADEVLIKVNAAALNAIDWHFLKADPFLVRLMGQGFFKPKYTILGADVAGRVEAAGKDVRQFQPGDEVFGDISASGFGAFAEYVCARQEFLALKPANLSFEQAAAVPLAGITALQALRDTGQLQPGQKVLINGASGGVGTFAVQIAKALGAEVTAVCSPRNVDRSLSLGADQVVDYTREDFTKSGRQYDLILAANGYHSLFDYGRSLRPGGRYVMVGGSPSQMYQAVLLGPLLSLGGDKKFGTMVAQPNSRDMAIMKELLEAGKVVPVIDRRYPLSETAEAFRYMDQGHAQGKIVISVE